MTKEVRLRLLLLGAFVTTCLLSSAARTSAAPSAAPKIELTEIECLPGPGHEGKLDLIYIHNRGDAAQDLTGWKLTSDPEDSQTMLLDIAGTLGPVNQLGTAPSEDKPRVIISAGSHAVQLPDSSMWLWSVSEILRDDSDPPDFVRLYDNNGDLVASKECPDLTPATPSPTPTPEPQVAAPENQASGQTGSESSTGGSTQGGSAGSQTATSGQNSQAASGGTAAGSVGAPNAGIGSLAPVGTSSLALSLSVVAVAAGFIGLAVSTTFLMKMRAPRPRAVVEERRSRYD
jgi:hypothetical protein